VKISPDYQRVGGLPLTISLLYKQFQERLTPSVHVRGNCRGATSLSIFANISLNIGRIYLKPRDFESELNSTQTGCILTLSV
jgi:hypothetical protein